MATPIRVLYIGGGGEAAVAVELQRGGFEPVLESVEELSTLPDALAAHWDIAIAGFEAADFGALEALRTIHGMHLDLPLIVVSSGVSDANAPALLEAGAADYVHGGSLVRLNGAVRRELRAAKTRRERLRLEEQFHQAQKMEAVGRLAGGMAHDFNNLLTIITGYADLALASRELKESHRLALEEIRRCSERGGQLTRQLLAFSRRQPLEPRLISVNDLVLQMEKMLRRLIGEDVELVTIPAASLDVVEGDAGRLEQVLMNLAVNARDAMPDGGKLTIETGTVQLSEAYSAQQLGVTPGPHVTISITDTGSGMDEETQSHLFEPFFTTKAPGHGTGLGLATAYGIIRQSGGAIGIISEVGKGTTARIYLPLVEQAPENAPGRAVSAAAGGGETILVVEDEARVRKLVVDVLTRRGYKVLEATRGTEALRLAATHPTPIDLALVDVVMPEMSGPEVVRELAPRHPSMRILYVSGYSEEAIVHHGVLESGAGFLQKPFLPETLAARVREALDVSGRAGAH